MNRFLVTILTIAIATGAPVHAAEYLHRAVGPDLLYPNTTQKLYTAIRELLGQAEGPSPGARLLACVAPHSALGLSGEVAAHAFKDLRPGQYDRVLVLAPAHYASFSGCSIAAVAAYETPLGLVPVDMDAVKELTRFGLISTRALRYKHNSFLKNDKRERLHEAEHSIEMVLPFLQVQLQSFKLIPILVGNLNDARNERNENIIESVADEIKKQLDDRTLLVISTDLTHFGNEHGYRPFRDNILERLEFLDKRTCNVILQHDYQKFQDFLKETGSPICGRTALELLFKILPEQAKGLTLAREIEARITGNLNLSISYGAINFYDLDRPPIQAPAPNTTQDGEPIHE